MRLEVGDGLRIGSGLGLRVRDSTVKWEKGASTMIRGSWKIRTLQSKSIELENILKNRRINIVCV